jgi:hypothetical protein
MVLGMVDSPGALAKMEFMLVALTEGICQVIPRAREGVQGGRGTLGSYGTPVHTLCLSASPFVCSY